MKPPSKETIRQFAAIDDQEERRQGLMSARIDRLEAERDRYRTALERVIRELDGDVDYLFLLDELRSITKQP